MICMRVSIKCHRQSAESAACRAKENAFLSEKLFLLQYLSLGFTKEDMVFDAGDWVNARELFQEWNFKSLLKDIGVPEAGGCSPREVVWRNTPLPV